MSDVLPGGNLEITEEKPELTKGSDADHGNSEQADPFTRDDSTKTEAGTKQIYPPWLSERSAFRIIIGEANPEKGSKTGEKDEEGV